MVANMWKNSLKNVESDDKILYETLLFLQWNGTFWISLVHLIEKFLLFVIKFNLFRGNSAVRNKL